MARKIAPRRKMSATKICELLQSSNISSMHDIQDQFKETIAEFMENGLDAELDDELGYSKYDYRNKDTDNSRNGHSSKTLQYPVPKATDTGAPIEAVDCQIRRKVMW